MPRGYDSPARRMQQAASDRLSDALRITAVQPLGVSPCITRSTGMPIRVEHRQKAKMITDVSQGAVPNHRLPGQKRRLGMNPGGT
jgi:hypothetical protein